MSSSRNYSSPPNDDSFIAERGVLNDGFRTRRDAGLDEAGVETVLEDRSIAVELKAVFGRNIAEWDRTTRTVIPPQGWTTWSIEGYEYRLKPYGVAFVTSANPDDEPIVRFAVDRFENGHWIEWKRHCANRFHDLKWNVSFELQFIEFVD